MRRILSIKFVISSVFIFMMSTPANAKVGSMSLEKFKRQGDKRYWEVKVKCIGDSQTKTMQRIVSGKKTWCSIDEPGLCNTNKFALSQLICRSNKTVAKDNAPSSEQLSQDSSAVEITEPIQANTQDVDGSKDLVQQVWTETESEQNDKEALKTNLMREQVQIEEQRILVEQKRLELVQRELALKKQQAN